MQRKKIFPLFFLFLLLSVLTISLFPQVNAVSYYNWIRNSSFEVNVNLFEDNGVESGIFNAGLVYGNFSTTDSVSVSSTVPHFGVYSFLLSYSSAMSLYYNLTDSILGADIVNARVYARKISDNAQLRVVVYYSDGTSNNVDCGSVSTSWVSYSFLSGINGAKYVVAFKFTEYTNYGGMYLDDFELGVYDVDNPDSQDEVYIGSQPWWFSTYRVESYYPNYPLPVSRLAFDQAHVGNSSLFIDSLDYPNYYGVRQFISWLDSNDVNYVDCWVAFNGVQSVVVQVTIDFMDGRSCSKNVTVAYTGVQWTWVHVNFGKNWIYDNSVCLSIRYEVFTTGGANSCLDDCGVWAEVPLGAFGFNWILSPSPQQVYPFSADCVAGINYVFSGTLVGLSDSNGSGIVSHNKGTTSFSVVNGTFSFVISVRAVPSATYKERFGISLIVDGDVKVFNVDIWWLTGGISEGGGEGEGGYDSWYSNMVVTYMVLFIFVIVPPLIIAFEFSKHDIDPFMGFIGGLCLTVPIAYIVHIIDLWVLFVFVLGLILMILSKLGALSRV